MGYKYSIGRFSIFLFLIQTSAKCQQNDEDFIKIVSSIGIVGFFFKLYTKYATKIRKVCTDENWTGCRNVKVT